MFFLYQFFLLIVFMGFLYWSHFRNKLTKMWNYFVIWCNCNWFKAAFFCTKKPRKRERAREKRYSNNSMPIWRRKQRKNILLNKYYFSKENKTKTIWKQIMIKITYKLRHNNTTGSLGNGESQNRVPLRENAAQKRERQKELWWRFYMQMNVSVWIVWCVRLRVRV